MIVVRLILALIVFGCIAISAVFAFEFGWSKGYSDVHRWAFGLAGGGLDLLKAAMPIIAASAMLHKQRTRGLAAWFVFCWLTIMSLWCAYGTTAGQLADRIANKATAIAEQVQRGAVLKRLQAERESLGTFELVTDEAVEAGRKAVDAAVQQKTDECGAGRGGRGPNCRDREKDEREARDRLVKLVADQGMTKRAEALNGKIAEAERALAAVDVRTISRDADPQAASMSKATGIDENKIALLSHLLFAIGIEAGSGFGLWLIFGHGAHRHSEPVEVEQKSLPDPMAVVTIESPSEGRSAFIQSCVLPAPGSRISGTQLYMAYQKWCLEANADPMSLHAFGRDIPLTKEKTGGTVYYVNATLADGYLISGPHLKVVSG